jgi:hypothetical protein
MRQGPWTGRYPAAAAMVIFALVPYLALSAALQPITPIIARDLHMSDDAPWRARPERMKVFVRRWRGTPGAVEMSDGRFG